MKDMEEEAAPSKACELGQSPPLEEDEDMGTRGLGILDKQDGLGVL